MLRTIEHGRSALPQREMRPAVIGAWVAGTLVVSAVGGWAVARCSGPARPANHDRQPPADEVAIAAHRGPGADGTGDYGAFEALPASERSIPTTPSLCRAWIVLNGASTTDTELRTASLDTAARNLRRGRQRRTGYANALPVRGHRRQVPRRPDVELAQTQGELCPSRATHRPTSKVWCGRSLDGLDDGLDDGLEDPPATSAPDRYDGGGVHLGGRDLTDARHLEPPHHALRQSGRPTT
ncbi:MAG: hypothetical protein R2713_23195 [Ilumatobacteraceae bacterium]